MITGGGYGQTGGPAPRSRALTVTLVVLGAIVLFGAGVALSWFLRGGNGGGGAAGPTSGASPTCVATTTVPGVGLPKPGTVSINVYNATDRTGLAASTAGVLKGRGFTVGEIANDPLGKTVRPSAELRYGPKGEQNAKLLSFYIPGAKLVQDDRTDASVDVVLGEKFKAVRSPAQVQKALTTPVVTRSGPGCSSSPAAPPASARP